MNGMPMGPVPGRAEVGVQARARGPCGRCRWPNRGRAAGWWSAAFAGLLAGNGGTGWGASLVRAATATLSLAERGRVPPARRGSRRSPEEQYGKRPGPYEAAPAVHRASRPLHFARV